MSYSYNVLEAIDKGLMSKHDIEKIAIGSAICFEECWQKAKPIIADVVFSDAKNKFLWGLLKDMKQDDLQVDVVTLWEYALCKYPQIHNPAELASYICETTLTVVYAEYDKVLSELLRLFGLERRYGTK